MLRCSLFVLLLTTFLSPTYAMDTDLQDHSLGIRYDPSRKSFYYTEESLLSDTRDKKRLDASPAFKRPVKRRGEKFLNVKAPTSSEIQIASDDDILAAVNAYARRAVHFSPDTLSYLGQRILDNRTTVETPTDAPYNAISHLELTFDLIDENNCPDTRTYFGTGVLIANGIILTAAHNLYDAEHNAFVKRIAAFPGRSSEEDPWIGVSKKFKIHPMYRKFLVSNYDIGVIDFRHAFEESISAKELFSFAVDYCSLEDLKDTELTLTGFPGVVNLNEQLTLLKRTMMTSKGNIATHKLTDDELGLEIRDDNSEIEDGTLRYDMVTTMGNSGSPVYFKRDDEIVCCGIHSDEGQFHEKFNIGIHIDEEIIKYIHQWIKEFNAD